MQTSANRTIPPAHSLNHLRTRTTTELDVDRARLSSTPEALTVIDPKASTMGLRAVADGFIVL